MAAPETPCSQHASDRRGIIRDAALWTLCRHRHKVHATGHEQRLKRSTLMEVAGFGSNPYCKEGLIAEMGAAFLRGQAEIAERTIDNSAAYLIPPLPPQAMPVAMNAAWPSGKPGARSPNPID